MTAVRLAIATLAVLAPGFTVACALRRPSASASVVASLAALFVGLTIVFTTGASFDLALWFMLALGLVAVPFAARELLRARAHRGASVDVSWALVAAAGGAFGVLLWFVLPVPTGDALFHLARVRKLVSLDELSLEGVGEFVDGGLHPGYAFPLWHGLVAAVARLAGVDPAVAVEHESAILAPISFLVLYESGRELFRSAWLGAAAVVATVALTAFSAGSGGAFRSLALPATAGGRLLLVPAALALLFAYVNAPSWRGLVLVALGSFVLAVVHPTYALFALLLVGGFLVAQALLDGAEVRSVALGLVAMSVAACLFLTWLFPVVQTAASYTPTNAQLENRAHGIDRYPGQIDYTSAARYRLAPEVISRSGPVPVAALALLPLALLSGRRRWAPFVLGATLIALAVLLVPAVFPRFVDAVSLSQARRLAGFIPFAIALVGGAAVLARLLSYTAIPLALLAGFFLERAFPGDFGYVLDEGGPSEIVWYALGGGTLALVVAAVLRRRLPALERLDWVPLAAVAAFVAPIVVGSSWQRARPATELTPGLVDAVRRDVPVGAVVLADPETSYWLAASAPVYVAVAPPAHVGDTERNRPYDRLERWRTFQRTGRFAGSWSWYVEDRVRKARPCRRPVYADARYTLCRRR